MSDHEIAYSVPEENEVEMLDQALALHYSDHSAKVCATLIRALSTAGYQGGGTVFIRKDTPVQWYAAYSSSPELKGLTLPLTSTGAITEPKFYDTLQELRSFDAQLSYFAIVPLRNADQIYGFFLFDSRVPIPLEQNFTALIDHFSYAYFVRRKGEAKREADVRSSLSLTAMQSILKIDDLKTSRILAKFMEQCVDYAAAQAGCIGFRVDSHKDFRICEWGIGHRALLNFRLKGDTTPLVERICIENKAVAFSDQAKLDFIDGIPKEMGLDNLLLFPLNINKRNSGYLALANFTHLSEEDMEQLTAMQSLACNMIDRSLMVEHEIEREVMEKRLQIAGEIQRNLLPTSEPDVVGVDIHGFNVPCDESGGDFYHWDGLGNSRFGFCLADATGHGIDSALIASTARAYLRSEMDPLSCDISIADRTEKVNRLCEQDFPDAMFTTLFWGEVDVDKRVMNYVCAGHDPPMLVYRPASDEFIELTSTGIPLGMLPNMTYKEKSVTGIESGDIFFVSSDGVHEAVNASGQLFGREGVQSVIRENKDLRPEEIVQSIYHKVLEHMEGGVQMDDITMVCFKFD